MKFIDEELPFARACKECRQLWELATPVSIRMFPRVLKTKKKQNEEVLTTLLERMEEHGKNNNIKELDKELLKWLHQDGIWNLSWLSVEERVTFHTISKQFMRDARQFDAQLSFEDIGQAIRNLWIILILEKVCGREMSYHKAMFAYSMLYPYTDNLLDDEALNRKEKDSFNRWLDRRLKGETKIFEEENQKKVHQLVEMIEECYERKRYPKVYEALLHIQHGQSASLLQYDVEDEDVLLEISIAKGGASVLADGYLMSGELSEEEETFCVKFGFLLQLADDIQDLRQDQMQSYHTLIGILDTSKERREFCEKYFGFVHEVIRHLHSDKDKRLQSFIEDNCRLLIYFSLQQDASMYPSIFMHHIRKRLPIRAGEMKQLLHKLSHMGSLSSDLMDQYLAIE